MKLAIEESVLRQALDALESCDYNDQQLKLGQYFDDGDVETAITALRTALDAAEKVEPVYQVWNRYDYPSHWEDVDESEYAREKNDDDKRILYTVPAEIESLRKDAAIGRVVWKFIDRMSDVDDCDPADKILAEFVVAVMPYIAAAMQEKQP